MYQFLVISVSESRKVMRQYVTIIIMYEKIERAFIINHQYIEYAYTMATPRYSFSVPSDDFDPLYDGEYYVDMVAEAEQEMAAEAGCIVRTDMADPISKLVAAGRADKKFKVPPASAHDARRIWLAAGIPDPASYNEVESCLLRWVQNQAGTTTQKGKLVVSWVSETGVKYTTQWLSFVRWMLCASLGEPK